MDLTPDQAALAVERHHCPNCDASAGSACRTRGGKTAAKYHTPRFVLVPALHEELEIPVPADRFPGRAWKQGPALAVVPAPRTERPVRIGYARTSTARQELASQLEALRRAECHKVFHEQISTRIKVRPELEKALVLAHQFKEAAPETPVIFTRSGRLSLSTRTPRPSSASPVSAYSSAPGRLPRSATTATDSRTPAA
ncbi:zinc finger domain-containing protein [Streptomyces atratus]|uniref:zinc finger domain-containing protein n=1 Tax=Streptomyces atratus TaxID=1893 RepID=UPI003F69AFE1